MLKLSTLFVLLMTAIGYANGEGHSHPNIHTPLGFKLTTERQTDGLSFVVRQNGHIIVFAPANTWFSKDAGVQGSSIAWRWQEGPTTGPFQSTGCLYESPFGNSVCDSDLYALQDGIFDDENDPTLGKSFNHVELPGHIVDLSALEDPFHFRDNLWIGGTTESLQRTPDGLKILPDSDFNVGTGPWLIVEGATVPEPSGLVLLLFGLAILFRRYFSLCDA